jgi:hypothetical protein
MLKKGKVVCLLIVFYPKILFAGGGSRFSSGLVDQRKIAPLAWGRPRVQIPTSPLLHFFKKDIQKDIFYNKFIRYKWEDFKLKKYD